MAFRKRFRAYRGRARASFARGATRTRTVVKRVGSAAASRARSNSQKTKNRAIAGLIAGAYGYAEAKGMVPSFVPPLFGSQVHTIALVANAVALFAKGSFGKVADHLADATTPISGYLLGRTAAASITGGIASDIEGELDGLAGDIEGDDISGDDD